MLLLAWHKLTQPKKPSSSPSFPSSRGGISPGYRCYWASISPQIYNIQPKTTRIVPFTERLITHGTYDYGTSSMYSQEWIIMRSGRVPAHLGP